MKRVFFRITYIIVLYLAVFFSTATAAYNEKSIYNTQEIESIEAYLKNKYKIKEISTEQIANSFDNSNREISLSDYETYIPLAAKPPISKFEKIILSLYLDNPSDKNLVKYLGMLQLKRSYYFKGGLNGKRLKHAILSEYFFSRYIDLGGDSKRIAKILSTLRDRSNNFINSKEDIDDSESREAHKFFIRAFTENEGNRFFAHDKLLEDFVKHPNSVFTAFYINALNLWVGGEAEYDDPLILYNFVVGSYFSLHTMDLAQRLEQKWQDDPSRFSRFRLASIIGGFSILQRRWLAQLHSDQTAIQQIDDEHRLWLSDINTAFHAFTVGVAFFEEDDNFLEGFSAWSSAFSVCEERDDLRTCPDRPRFTFNQLSMILSYVDYFLKIGDTDTAQFLLSLKNQPNLGYTDWDLGRDAWEHREENLFAIAELYANNNPEDDPTMFVMRSKKWSASTSTCQTCHQVQSKIWTQEEKDTVWLPPEDILTVGEWPEVSTTWYGASD